MTSGFGFSVLISGFSLSSSIVVHLRFFELGHCLGDNGLAALSNIRYALGMSVREIKDKLVTLTRKEQDEVIAFLFHLRHAEDVDYQKDLNRRAVDKDQGHWLTPNEFEHELDKKERR